MIDKRINLVIDGDELCGEIEELRNGRLVGWIARKDDASTVEVLVASPEGHATALANAYRSDILFKFGKHGYSGFSINLGGLVTLESPPEYTIKVFLSANGVQTAPLEISLEKADMLRGRYNVQLLKLDNGMIEARYTAEFDGKNSSQPRFLLRNALGQEVIKLSSKRVMGLCWTLSGRVALSKIINAGPLELFIVSDSGEFKAPDPIVFGVIYHLAANKDLISGWAVCPVDSSARVLIRIANQSDPDTTIGATRATLFRSDLKKITNTDGFYGFVMPRPQGENLMVSLTSALTENKITVKLNWPSDKPEVM